MKQKIKGYRGYWNVIETAYYNGEKVYFMEHDFHGDETCYLICKAVGFINHELVAIAETYDGFYETLGNMDDYLI